MPTDQISVSVAVRVLGGISIDVDGVAVALPESLRAVALLGWLAIHAGPRSRSTIRA